MSPDERMEIGEAQFRTAFRSIDVEHCIERTGIYGLTWFIQAVLDEHYPADIFGDGDVLYPTWASEIGGTDIDPGAKWAALLRHAIKEVAK